MNIERKVHQERTYQGKKRTSAVLGVSPMSDSSKKNYLPSGKNKKESLKKEVTTIDVEVNTEAEDKKKRSKKRDKFLFGSDSVSDDKETKARGLPWKEMFAFYVRGEWAVKGGIRHTTSPTYKDVAERFNCAYATVCRYAAENNWKDKRKKYRGKLSTEFSFDGQLAADTNGQVLNCASILVKKLTKKIVDPTFLATSDSIVEGVNGNFYVYDIDSPELLPLPPAKGKESEIVAIEKITKSLESINRICNNTVHVEIENAALLDELKGSSGSAKDVAKERMKRISQLQKNLSPSSRKSMKEIKQQRVENAAKARSAKAEKKLEENRDR